MVDCVDKEDHYLSKIVVSAPNLVSFTCTDHVPNTYHLKKLSSLESADLDVFRFFYEAATEGMDFNILMSFSLLM